MLTKTVIHPETQQEYVLVECSVCGGTGKYWRDEIFSWWPCNACEGFGCLTIEKAASIKPHPHAFDRPYKPVKGRA